ncbi:hypothetical protein N7462_008429 [Penicillium macrosclerotiorum]|uniref:uncharacterized protein n=1 Tax=Penicillium macrosclerotiorum TaxID=303699 RepID=UPI0025473B0C|nr:uncharacterized protein N7462_008429 [Penicillium macrosclerotiorum]KAJ5675532.1 hypothetical protein N7462_008429 [Penicillium macrosclerotiorum]
MALDEKMKLWSDHDADSVDDEECSKPIQESDIFPDAEGECSPIPADIVDLHPEIKIGETFKVVMPELHEYREYIVRHPAYDWLLSDLQRHCLHNSSTQEVRAEINRTILHGLPSQTRFSRRDSELPYKMTYTVDWDLISFLEDQDYNEESFKALPLVITITGSRKAAQALTCSQYLHQIWPSSAGEVLKLLQTLLESGPRNKARGSAYSIAEVGEQLSWLGSALRSSPYPDPIAYCRPQVEKFQMTDYKSQTAKRQFTAEVSADISFAMDRIEFSSNASGECWHDLFRNCVVVQGYPISRRLECGASSGLEIPLHMMACLAKANFVNTFRNCLILKGFSAMLVPTENYDEVIVWHLVYNKNGDRISYLDSTVDPAEGLIAGRLSQARHILGWCSDTRYLAGGEPFLDGYKDVPFHISRGGYLKKLKWIIQKSAVLWDEETKQGWLLNGAGALLHLVRASIMHDSTGPLSSECLFRWENLEEAPAHITRTPESAIAVLSDRGNRALTIYQDKDEHINFEDRVEHFLNIFEQIFDYQVHAVGPDGSGYSSKSIPRAHFEGWDFHDLSTESDPLFPRLAKIPVKGKSWIDFTRSIHTINLFGRGFGEMLEPSTVSCPYWASLPRDQYYLAAGIAELQQMVVKYTGDLTANPVRLSENLVWHNPKMVFEFCDCADATADHADLVQVILPATLSDEPQQCNNTVTLARNGAVVFGYNRRFRWRWGDIGDPERDDIKDNNEVPVASTYISGHDDIKTQVGSESDYFRLSNTQASSIKDTVATSSADHGSARPNHLLRSYTKWNLESLRAEDYAVGILCALPLELLAVRALFDQTHPDLSLSAVDSNHYALGRIGRHKVVTACLPYGEYGTNSAADVASNLRRSFPSVKFCLLVGIGGGVPSPRHDIRLGDVVVSKPIGISPGVIQYDMGKALENGVFEQSGFLQAPSRVIMTALSILESDPHLPPNPLQEYIEEITACRKEYRYPGPENDRLFSSVYAHNPKHATCDSCSISHVTTRPSRSNHHPQIHYGLIASGNRVMKDAKLRDIWCMERDVLCFEMEAAGIVNTFPCLVIRGICDYSDSHKNKQFQEYAAATAASYAKLLLYHLKDSIHLNGTA